jgi:hypothetical protein
MLIHYDFESRTARGCFSKATRRRDIVIASCGYSSRRRAGEDDDCGG